MNVTQDGKTVALTLHASILNLVISVFALIGTWTKVKIKICLLEDIAFQKVSRFCKTPGYFCRDFIVLVTSHRAIISKSFV